MEEKDTKIIIAKRSCIACYENNERALGLEQRPLRFLFPSLETAIAQYRTNRDSANREAMHALEEAGLGGVLRMRCEGCNYKEARITAYLSRTT